MDDSCAVCADSLEWVAYGACDHKDVCSTCVARLRFICDDLNCCICKTKSDAVFVTKFELSPTCVSSLLGINIEGVAAGLWHTVCISADGDVYAFGGNQFGQLGTRTDQAETLPRLLDAPSLENVNAKIVSSGARHSAVITGDGKAFCWGWNKYGQLGLGDVIDRNTPTQVSVDGCVARNIACGRWHTLLLAESPT